MSAAQLEPHPACGSPLPSRAQLVQSIPLRVNRAHLATYRVLTDEIHVRCDWRRLNPDREKDDETDPWPTGKNQEGPTLLEHFSVDNPMGEVELALGDMPVARLKLSCATPKEVRTLLSKELGVEFHVEVLKRREILASGLKWRKIGATAPDGGRKLDNPELAQAL